MAARAALGTLGVEEPTRGQAAPASMAVLNLPARVARAGPCLPIPRSTSTVLSWGMSRDDDIIASVRNAVEQRFPALNDAIQKFQAGAAGRGVYLSSMTVGGTHRLCIDGYREMCVAAAAHLAEIEGEDAPRHADSIGRILKDMQPRIIELFGWDEQGARSSGSLLGMAAKLRGELQAEMSAEVENTIRDLRLGVAGGVNVKKRQQFYIDNRGGAGQFVVNSPASTQSIGQDQTAVTNEFSPLLQVLADVRQQVAQAQLSADDKDAIEDAVVAVERELDQPQSDQSRLKRLVLGLGKLLRDVIVPVASQAVAAYAKAKGWIPPA
jgi:hypothetical protein